MNPGGLIPTDVLEQVNRDARYTELLLQNLAATPEQRAGLRDRLGLNPTPRDVVYSENSLELLRFRPTRKRLHKTPILIVPSLICRYYVLDLMKEHSLIEHLVDQGYDTWVIDWGVPGEEHGTFALEDYVGTFLRRCARQVMRKSGRPRISVLGQCLGGVLALMYAAVHPEHVERMVCLTVPVDFEDAGVLALWTRKENYPIDTIVGTFGNLIPGEFVHAWFRLLDVKATVQTYKRLYKNVLDETFTRNYAALDTWLNDKIPFAAPAFRDMIAHLYQENRLLKGAMCVHGQPAELSAITCPILNIAAQHDHVFPERAVSALNDQAGGPVEYYCAPTGHVSCVVLFPQRLETYRRISAFLA